MEGGGEEIKNTCAKKGGEGIGGRGRLGGKLVLRLHFLFFLFQGKPLIIVLHDQ